MTTGRVYTEYDKKFQAEPKQVKKRVARNKARRMYLKKLQKKYGARRAKSMMVGKDVDHIVPLEKGGETVMSNLRLLIASGNRAKKNL
ncbi:MAG: HNH endonuclease [Saezia sp.]